jgi:O-antigen/teichoic acid export membrane protein
VLRSLVWQGGASAIGQVFAWVATLVVIRLLTPEDYGVVALAGVLFGFLSLSFDFGIAAALVQARELRVEDLRSAQSSVLLFGLCAAGVLAACGPMLARLYAEPRLTAFSLGLALVMPIIALSHVPQALAVRQLRFDRKARADLAAMIAASLTTLVLAFLGAGPWALIAGIAVTHTARAAVYLRITPEGIRPSPSLLATRKFARFGSLLSLDRLLWFLFTNVDLLIVGKVLGEGALGLYVVTLSLSSLPLDKVAPLITQVAFPTFSQVQDEPEHVRGAVIASIRYSALAFVPISWGAALLAPEALPLLLGPRWEGGTLLFQLLCTTLPLRAITSLLSPALMGTGLIRTNVQNLGITFAVMGIAYLVGVRFGLDGMAFAWLLAFPAVFVWTSSRALRALQVPVIDVLAACRWAVASGLVMVGVVALVRMLLAGNPIALLVISSAVGAATYIGVIRSREPRILEELGVLFGLRSDAAAPPLR